jgi:hypothetical protein
VLNLESHAYIVFPAALPHEAANDVKPIQLAAPTENPTWRKSCSCSLRLTTRELHEQGAQPDPYLQRGRCTFLSRGIRVSGTRQRRGCLAGQYTQMCRRRQQLCSCFITTVPTGCVTPSIRREEQKPCGVVVAAVWQILQCLTWPWSATMVFRRKQGQHG